jgi:hypothetical protein
VYVSNEREPSVETLIDHISDIHKYRETKGYDTMFTVQSEFLDFEKPQGLSWVSRSRCLSLIGERVDDHVCRFPEPSGWHA